MNRFAVILTLVAASVLSSPVYASAKSIRTANPPVDGFGNGQALSGPISITPLAAQAVGGNFSISVPTSPTGAADIDTEWYQNNNFNMDTNENEAEDAIDWCQGPCDLALIDPSNPNDFQEEVMGDVIAQLWVQPDPGYSFVQAYVYFQCADPLSLAISSGTTTPVPLPDTCGKSTVGEADYLVDISSQGQIQSVSSVSEPAAGALFAAALGLLLVARRFRRRQESL